MVVLRMGDLGIKVFGTIINSFGYKMGIFGI